MAESTGMPKRDRFGEISALVGLMIYGAAIIFFCAPLDDWIDTFLVVTWVFAPAVMGALIYARMERNGRWNPSNRLK